MPQRQFAEEYKWLEELAREVDAFGGFYKKDEAAAIYCPNCETIQAYCTGCGQKLIDVYDEATATCENCGISLAHCGICGHPVETMDAAPEHLQKPEYWKYCPACGEAVFATTDMCPHCKVSMGNHLDTIYEETYQNVNRAVLDEEMREDGMQLPYDGAYKSYKQVNHKKPSRLLRFIVNLLGHKICPECNNIYEQHHKICLDCGANLLKKKS